jgi:hypothetical protein
MRGVRLDIARGIIEIGRKPDGDLSAGGEPELVKYVADVGIHGPDRNV